MANGFLPLNRRITNHWIWKSKPFSDGQAWIDLLLLATHTDGEYALRGNPVMCKRGDVNISMLELSRRWGWDRKKVARYLKKLERNDMLIVNASKHRTVITIVNYDTYNAPRTTENIGNSTFVGTDRAMSGQRIEKNDTTNRTTTRTTENIGNSTFVGTDRAINNPTNKATNSKKVTINNNVSNNNVSNISASQEFIPPTIEDIERYCEQNNYNVDAKYFFNYYEAQGWVRKNGLQIKNWKAVLRTWDDNNRNSQNIPNDEGMVIYY